MKVLDPRTWVVSATKGLTRCLALAAVMVLPHLYAHADVLAAQSEPSVLHIMSRTPMTNTGVDLDASGNVNTKITRQGNASQQGLRIVLTKLDPNTTYQVAAFLGDDINPTNVLAIVTDSKGAFEATYREQGQAIIGADDELLPDLLNPLRNVRELEIVSQSAQAVLHADLTDPGKLQYLVNRAMDNTGIIPDASGTLRIKATEKATQFRLTASGLPASTDFVMTINGIAARTKSTDRAGKWKLLALPQGAPDVLDIHAVALTDIAGNVVLTVGGGRGGVGIPPAGLASVPLRSASSFAVLAGSTVTNTGATTVHGNLGVSPGTAVVGFPPGTVLGSIHAGDSTAAQAQLDLTLAYNDAAGRTVGAIVLAGNLGGQTLTPGLYKSTSSLEISSGDLTLDAQGDADAIFIFQVASTLTTTSGRQVILAGGAKATNVYWQVGSSATLGTTSAFKGTIMADQSITLTSGAVLEGRALARIGAVTLDGNIIGLDTASDTTRPVVNSTVPADSASNVALGANITATFSEAMNPLTVTTGTFTLNQGATSVPGTVSYAGTTATFNPLSSLAPSTTYTATINLSVEDLAGNALANDYVWSFTTGGTLDTTAPIVSFTAPTNGASSVPIGGNIAATFTEVMDSLTITTATFRLKQGATPVSGTVSYAGVTATFNPTGSLLSFTTYTATVTTGARDLAGNPLAAEFVWSFTTGATADTTSPAVNSTVPANGASGVPIGGNIAATFSEPMAPLSINNGSFTLYQGAIPVAGTVSYAGVTATFNPASNLASSTIYTATINSGATDLAGNALAATFVWSFTTGATLDTIAPTVSFTVPSNGAAGVPIGGNIAATFSEAMNPLTVTTATFTLKQGGTPVTGTVSYAGVTAVFNPTSTLAPSTTYTATISTDARDLAGNALAGDYVWSFTTGVTPDTIAPTVSSTVPVSGASGFPIGGNIAATFSEAMNPLTVTIATFTLKQGATPVTGTVSYAGVTAVFNPTSTLAPGTIYTATINTGAKDLAGNVLGADFVWSFTTGTTLDTTAPAVNSTVPASGAIGVLLGGNVAATFSEAMDPLTITNVTFSLRQGTTPVSGTVSYAGMTATFNPQRTLDPSTVFTARITSEAKDLAGNALAGPFEWSFSTGETPDTIAPTVSITVPADAATGVAINQTINATFSETIDPLTINTATFRLAGPGATIVTGTVAYDTISQIATLNPTSNLAPSTFYTATMTTGVKDLAGNPLASDFVWSFTTSATSGGQPPVTFGSSSTFAVLAGSTVTNTSATTLNGDLGVSPGTAITGFLIIDGGPGIVNGTTYSVTPGPAATAQDDLTIAYNDAAGRTVGVIAVDGNLGGQTLTPGLYKSTSSLEISSGDLTLDAQGDANAVFIFQIASTLTTTTGRHVILSGGARAGNVYWQVGSSATLGTTSVFKGTIMADQSITLTTGAVLDGRALARIGAVTLDANTITVPVP